MAEEYDSKRRRKRTIAKQRETSSYDVAQDIFTRWTYRAQFRSAIKTADKYDLINRIVKAIERERAVD